MQHDREIQLVQNSSNRADGQQGRMPKKSFNLCVRMNVSVAVKTKRTLQKQSEVKKTWFDNTPRTKQHLSLHIIIMLQRAETDLEEAEQPLGDDEGVV